MTAQGEQTAGAERRPRPVWLRVASGGVVALLVAVAAIYAWRADGQPVHDVALTDGGIWVSGGRTGYWGRVNTGAHELDLVVQGAGRSGNGEGVVRPDVLQDGRQAIGVTADRQLVAIDTRTGEPVRDDSGTVETVQMPEPHWATGQDFQRPDLVALGGDTLAFVDHDTGRIVGTRLDPEGGSSIGELAEVGPLDTVGPRASITVDDDGDIMAVSAQSGRVVEIPAKGDGFGTPKRTSLGFTGRAADITAVGDAWVVLDLETGKVMAEGLEQPQALPASNEEAGQSLVVATLQQPGPASHVVAYSTVESAGFMRIDSDSDGGNEGEILSGIDEDSGDGVTGGSRSRFNRISRPALNGPCLYAAWGEGGTIRWGRTCTQDKRPTVELPTEGEQTRRNGVAVRQARGQLVLNDLDTGRVFDLSLPDDVRIDTWPGGAPRDEIERYEPTPWGRPTTSSPTTSPTTATKTG
jgi:hypothetical protein